MGALNDGAALVLIAALRMRDSFRGLLRPPCRSNGRRHPAGSGLTSLAEFICGTAEAPPSPAALLAAGKVVAVFPAGGVATANKPLSGRAVDSPWHPFVGRLASIPGVTTLPVHFSGQNSRLFQIASHTSYALRVALIFHETRRRIGRPIELRVGAPVPAAELARLDRDQITAELRRRCMALAAPALPDPEEVYNWPSRIKW